MKISGKKTILLIAVPLIVIAAGIFYKVRSITGSSIVSTKYEGNVIYTSLADKLKHSQPFTILLLGFAGGTHDGTYLTDSMMVAHINPSLRKISLISIPRDTWVPIPLTDSENKHWKINAAYELGLNDKGYPNKKTKYTGDGGGGTLVKDVVSQVFGQTIDRFVAIDFAGFTYTIDTLGGVDINVETGFDDYAYPLEDIKDDSCGHSPDEIKTFISTVSAEPQIWSYFPCRYKHLHFDTGMIHMDGKTSLEYVRSRHSALDGSDFGRAKRQRNLLLAVKDKIMAPSFLTQILPFLESLGNDLKTDISLTDFKSLLQNISTLSTYDIQTYALTDTNYLNQDFSDDGQAILVPKEGFDQWSKIHEWLKNIFSGNPILTPAIVQVENGTKTPGLAQKVSDELHLVSIQTATPINNPVKTDTTTITIYDKSINPQEVSALVKKFGVQGIISSSAPTQEFNIRVVLGKDYLSRISTPTPTISPN